MNWLRLATVALAVLVISWSVVAESGASEFPLAQGAASGPAVIAGDTLRFIAHRDHIEAGFPLNVRPLDIRDPYEGNRQALAQGARLFVAYNCIDCHGAEGSGAMGPSFQDGRWRYGGTAAEVFESIYQGRPDGMPAWGGRISDDQVWMLAGYVRSVAAGKDPTTENFTGRAVERMGH